MPDELKPLLCPFCNGNAKIDIYDYEDASDFMVNCPVCHATGIAEVTKEEAITAWNTRPIEDALRAENAKSKVRVEAAEEMIKELTDISAYIAEYERDKFCMRPTSGSLFALTCCLERLKEARAKWEALK